MIQFYVKDLSKLESYGFFDANETEYWIRLKRSINLTVNKFSKLMVLYSPSRECVALICEMYKNGDVEIYDDKKDATFNMKVTEEEMKMIFERRKANEQGNRK